MWRFFQYFQRFLTVLRLDGGIAFGIKQLRHAFPDMSIVVHQEHKFMVYSFDVCHREGLSDKESGKYQADWEATICVAFGLETALNRVFSRNAKSDLFACPADEEPDTLLLAT